KSQINDYQFITESDAEVLLAAYIKVGENCLHMLNGMFAFAVWDNVKKTLFLARDRMGIKPLYYVLTENEIVFSSSVKAILASNLVEKRIEKNSLVDYLRFQTVHAPYTLISGIFSL